jgi:hypothetical protein
VHQQYGDKMSTIFVQIAAYDDDELPKTIIDCIEKSSGDHEIFFGVHECYINNKTIIDNPNVRIQYSKAPKNLGVGTSRYIANKLYNGEDYYLQIDCHTRFKQYWDIILIKNLKKNLDIGNKCILTGYPPEYRYGDDGKEILDIYAPTTTIKLKRDQAEKTLFKNTRKVSQEGVGDDLTFCTESLSAGFIFGTGSINKVLQHPGIFYSGEEFLRAATFYSHGYNLMYPDVPVVFHLYGVNSKRVPCWDTYPEETKNLEEVSVYIIKQLLSEYNRDPTYNTWFGSERSLEMFGKYLAIDFKNGIIY